MVNARRFFALGIIVLIALGAAGPAPGQESENQRAIKVKQDQKARSAIVAVDGYAQLSEESTIKDARSMAFANAKRQALESAKTYIKSKTKVKNFQLEYDLVKAEAAGFVTVLEQKDLGIEKNSRYHVWIRAEVKYDLKPPSQAVEMDPDAPLTVKVWTDKKSYKLGDMITIFIHANRDFYGRIVNQTSSGQLIQLLPNSFRAENFFRGNRTYTIPGPGDQFSLEVTPPFGNEKIIVFASETPTGDVALRSLGGGLKSFDGSLNELSRGVRAVRVAPKAKGTASAEFYQAAWHLSTASAPIVMPHDVGDYKSTSKGERSLKRLVPERPIDMTGAAGRQEDDAAKEPSAR